MKHERSSSPIPRAARLSPAARARLRRSVTEAAERAHTDLDLEHGLTPRVQRGPVPEMELHAHLQFIPMKKETVQKLRRGDGLLKSRRPAEALKAGSDEIETLRKAEPRLLEWMAESDENAVLFTADPLKALGEAGLKLEPPQLLRLRLLRHRNLASADPAPRSPITRIKVSVGEG